MRPRIRRIAEIDHSVIVPRFRSRGMLLSISVLGTSGRRACPIDLLGLKVREKSG